MIVEVAHRVDRPVVEVEARSITAVRLTGRTAKEFKSERDRVARPRDPKSRGFGENIGLSRRHAQASITGSALQCGKVEIFVEGVALPIDAVLEP